MPRRLRRQVNQLSRKTSRKSCEVTLVCKLPEFLFEGALAMMLLLRGDILPYRLHHAGADCEHRITLLPLKLPLVSRSDQRSDAEVLEGNRCCREAKARLSSRNSPPLPVSIYLATHTEAPLAAMGAGTGTGSAIGHDQVAPTDSLIDDIRGQPPVLIVGINRLPPVPSVHHVINRSGILNSELASHNPGANCIRWPPQVALDSQSFSRPVLRACIAYAQRWVTSLTLQRPFGAYRSFARPDFAVSAALPPRPS